MDLKLNNFYYHMKMVNKKFQQLVSDHIDNTNLLLFFVVRMNTSYTS